VTEFYDAAAVSDADLVDSRTGFAALLERIEGCTRGRYAKLRERGIDLIAADDRSSFIDDTPQPS
jgi:hypothetical protein